MVENSLWWEWFCEEREKLRGFWILLRKIWVKIEFITGVDDTKESFYSIFRSRTKFVDGWTNLHCRPPKRSWRCSYTIQPMLIHFFSLSSSTFPHFKKKKSERKRGFVHLFQPLALPRPVKTPRIFPNQVFDQRLDATRQNLWPWNFSTDLRLRWPLSLPSRTLLSSGSGGSATDLDKSC